MSAISIALTPGYQFTTGELLTNAKLNALGQPAIQLQGQLSTQQLGAQAVTTPILADGAVTEAKVATGTFTPDGTGAAPFAAGFLSNLFVSQAAGPVAGRTNCVCTNNATTPLTQVTTTADELVLKDANDNYYRVRNVNVTANSLASGVNGLDTGTVAASTWYYVYVISNGPTATTPTVQALISTGQPAPAALPTGYTYYALVGAVFTNTSNQFPYFRAFNRRMYTQESVIFTSQVLTTGWAAQTTNPTGGTVSGLPVIAKRAYGMVGTVGAGGCGVANDANGTGACYGVGTGAAVLDGFSVGAAFFDVAVTTPQTVFVKSSTTGGINRLLITGYEF
jgi:hypothetical protein